MTTLTTSDCPRGARCLPKGDGTHEVTYLLKLLRGEPAKPFVLTWELDDIDFYVDVAVELQVRSRMTPDPEAFEVNLYPVIDFAPCSTYFEVENWTNKFAETRKEMLHHWHHEIVRALGGQTVLAGWINLQDVPEEVTILGASIKHVQAFVNDKLKGCG